MNRGHLTHLLKALFIYTNNRRRLTVKREREKKRTMPRTPRGGKALSRAASGRVPGPSTTDSSLNGIMLLIIFVTVLMVASFEHS